MNIPNAEKDKWASGSYSKKIKLYFPELRIGLFNEDVYAESMTLEESLFDGNQALEIFGCIASRFSIEIRNKNLKLKGKMIEVSISIDNEPYRYLFHGYVDGVETVRDKSYQKLTCYDALYKYSDYDVYSIFKNLPIYRRNIKGFRDALFWELGIQQKAVTLVNDALPVRIPEEEREIAFIDAIRDLCQVNGVFGIINRDGQFEYRDLSEDEPYICVPSNLTFPSATLFAGTMSGSDGEYIDAYKSVKYEDYQLEKITKVVVRDSDTDEFDGVYGKGANKYLIENNMFALGLSGAEKRDIAKLVLNKIKDINYIPFDAVNLGLPWIEVGQTISYYIYDYSSGQPVTSIKTFNVMNRYLKGIQWLEDNYSAEGSEKQPIVKRAIEGGVTATEVNNAIEENNKEIDKKIDEMSGSTNIISVDELPTNRMPNTLYLVRGEVVVE